MPRQMTLEGYTAINAEIDDLWHVQRPAMVQSVADAAALGDRSENAEYIYGKKRLREIDSRIRYLTRKVDQVTVVNLEHQKSVDFVQFGAVVTVEDEEGETKTWRLVDKDESDPSIGRISVQSPIGRALLGKEEGDVVSVHRPKGDMEYEIVALRFGGGAP